MSGVLTVGVQRRGSVRQLGEAIVVLEGASDVLSAGVPDVVATETAPKSGHKMSRDPLTEGSEVFESA